MKRYFFLLAAIFMMGCRGEEPVLPSAGTQVTDPAATGDIKGFFLLNEGNKGSNKASLDFFDYTSGIYHRNIFPERNPDVARELGDVGNDLQIHGDRLYAVIDNSGLVEVMDAATARHVGIVTVPSCRYIAFHDGFGYVTSYAGKVFKFDLATLDVAGECPVGREPEEMAVIGNMLYVANSGGYTLDNLETTVSVIDLETFTETRRIEVAPNLHRVEVDPGGHLWVSSREGGVSVVEPLSGEIIDVFDMPCDEMALDGESLYILGGGGYTVVDTRLREIVAEHPLPGLEKPYCIAIHPENGEILIADARNYFSSGTLDCHTPDGTLKWQAKTGDIPSRIAFSRHRLSGGNVTPHNPVEPIRVHEYTPAPGQFIGDGWSASTPAGAAAWAEQQLNSGGMVSLGAFGGYIVVALDVENRDGPDFTVGGNAFSSSSEPGIVWVAQDSDGDGSHHGELWHELRGSELTTSYSITYTRSGNIVTWAGSDGATGEISRSPVHTQSSYYPAWLPDGHQWHGSLLPPLITGGGESWSLGNFEWGYADNLGNDYSRGKTALELDNADIPLTHIDFIKVQTGVIVSAGWLGELSTEVTGFEKIK